METSNVKFPENINQLLPLEKAEKAKPESASEKEKVAKDFESLVLNQLFDQMKSTVGNWGFEKDSTTNQVEGIFWYYLAQDVADNGGLGLWKDIYKTLPDTEQENSTGQLLNGNL